MCNPSTNQVPLNVRAGLESNIHLGLRSPTGALGGGFGGGGWKAGESLPRPCLSTCPYLHVKSIASLGLSEVLGVGRILSEAMSCLDKLDSPWQLSMGWSRWVEAEK